MGAAIIVLKIVGFSMVNKLPERRSDFFALCVLPPVPLVHLIPSMSPMPYLVNS